MNTTHDDLPHPIPHVAHLRWKENYFFIMLDPEHDIFGMAHFSYEPAFGRGRMSCNMQVKGKAHRYASEIPFPERFEMSPELGDTKLRLTIIESNRRFRLQLDTADCSFDVLFSNRFPRYDFAASAYAAPENTSVKELLTFGTNLQYNHIQQGMSIEGTLTAGGERLQMAGYGYRDHSWSMRTDNVVANHTWCGISFPDRVFGVITLDTLVRPGTVAKEGYVADGEGVRSLRSIEVELVGKAADGLPRKLIHRLSDVYGRRYTIESDIEHRLAQVPLDVERSPTKERYMIAETFCRSVQSDGSAQGISLVELGRHSSIGGLVDER